MDGRLGKRFGGRVGGWLSGMLCERLIERLCWRLDKINKYRLVESDNTIQFVLYMDKRISERLDETLGKMIF